MTTKEDIAMFIFVVIPEGNLRCPCRRMFSFTVAPFVEGTASAVP
jgi:hypothetical protein